MRMTDEAFEAEVRRRAAVYQQQQRRRKRILMTACPVAACLLLVIGTASFSRANLMDNADRSNMAADAPQIDNETANSPKKNSPPDRFSNASEPNMELSPNGEAAEPSEQQSEEQELVISCETKTIQHGTHQLNISVTNHGNQTAILSSMQFRLSRETENGIEVGYYVDWNPKLETRVAVSAGRTVPFVIELDAYEEMLPAGNYTLRLGMSEIQFTIT